MADFVVYDNTAVNAAAKEALIKEQVDDLVINMFPLDATLQRTFGRVYMGSVFQQTPIDTFPAAYISRTASKFVLTNPVGTVQAQPEGATYTSVTPSYQAKFINVAEIQGLQFAVTGTDMSIETYGMTDRFSYEALRATQALVNQFELSLWWSPGTPPQGVQLHTSGGLDVGRQTQGLCHTILQSGLQRSKIGLGAAFSDLVGNNFGSGVSALNTGASTWCYDANGLPLDQAMFKDNLMAKWWEITGRQSGAMGFTGARGKNMFSQFATHVNGSINDRQIAAENKMLVDTLDVYDTDFGPVGMNLSRYLNINDTVAVAQSAGSTTVAWNEVMVLIQPQYYKIGVKRPITLYSIGKTRDAEDGLVLGELGLITKNPQAGVGVVNFVP